MEKLKMHTPDLAEENYKKLAALFPDAITETVDDEGNVVRAIDKDVLMQEINTQVVDDGQERYQFTWPDKGKSVVLANAPIAKTLRFEKEKSVGRDGTPGGTDSENVYIEGDNLDALKLLQETYLGKVKLIYIDPPYNTGSDFVYRDSFNIDQDEYEGNSGQTDEDGNQLVQNLESNGRFHTDWLNMIYPRLKIAKDLLSNDGAVFISIDNCEFENLTKICNEVFGAGNFVDCITWNTRVPKNDNKGLGNIHQYILVYVKDKDANRQFTMQKDGIEDVFALCEDLKRRKVPIPKAEKELKAFYKKNNYDRGITLYNSLDNNYQPWGKINMSWPNSDTFGPTYDVLHPATHKPTKKPDRGWRWNLQTFESHLDYGHTVKRYDGSYVCGDIWFAKDENTQPSSIKYLCDVGKMLLRTVVSLKSDGGMEVEKLFGGKSIFSNPKPTALIQLLINALEEKDEIIFDFFSGSATTAHAAMRLNAEDGGRRKFILVQLPEITDEKSEAYKAGYKTICEIGEERIRRAGKEVKEETGADIDYGFRCFKVDSSNMKDVYYRPADIGQMNLDDYMDNIKEDRTPEDLLIQVMLDLGVQLSSKVELTEIGGKKVFSVEDGYLIACFDKDVTEDVVTEIAKRHPFYFVSRDSSMASDSVAANFEEIFKTYSPETVRKVL
ncbi:site-specific DNA-methyltransferase [Limosilactobacillus mucosae]|jgi:adenine-specific DNA-methyltransferase|uniref:site-specific DNA-methyltransferase n=1 Tax=Limosilactobacillus mucosae TaxID=97478 RepID=UPI0022E18EDC|nr:site-specific DNA-methyltransferase [Limosilactobacillus mucosae]